MPQKVDEILARVGAVAPTPAGDRRLAAMLRQDGARLAGLSTREAERVRGHILAAFAGRRPPPAALAAIEEELRTSLSPLVLAGAARAVAGLEADPKLAALLGEAGARIALHDEYVAFGGSAAPATAGEEIAAALASLEGAPRPCCAGSAADAEGEREAAPFDLCPGAVGRVTVEDQSGAVEPLGPLLRSRPSLIAFFYTRCMNPVKCSLTVTRLGAVGRAAAALPGGGPNLLAISYDPAFDEPARLRGYGEDRGFPFNGQARLLRCRTGWPDLRRAFSLDVGYGASTVNGHARELFLVSPGLEATPLDPEAIAAPEAVLARVAAAEAV